jgi:hypothetical protein
MGTMDRLFDGSDAHMLPDANTEMARLLDVTSSATAETVALRNALRWVVSVYMVDDEAWDRADETEKTMQRVIAQHGR